VVASDKLIEVRPLEPAGEGDPDFSSADDADGEAFGIASLLVPSRSLARSGTQVTIMEILIDSPGLFFICVNLDCLICGRQSGVFIHNHKGVP
jgi:hypothetical protein